MDAAIVHRSTTTFCRGSTWKPQLRLAEENGLALDAYRFDTLDFFYELAAPVRFTEAA